MTAHWALRLFLGYREVLADDEKFFQFVLELFAFLCESYLSKKKEMARSRS